MKLVYRNSDRLIIAIATKGSNSDHVNWSGDDLIIDDGYTAVEVSEYPVITGPSRYTAEGVVELIPDFSPI